MDLGAEPASGSAERPVLFVVKKKGASVTPEQITDFLSEKVAKWWLPDAVEFVEELPHTATGKISKRIFANASAAIAWKVDRPLSA
ncbi:MAG: hypothetical protein R3E04_04100 [Sphingobium sp.]